MKKNTLKKASAILTTAIMTISALGMTVSAQTSKKTISLHDKAVYAGETVEIPLTIHSGNQCTSYDLLVEFDSNLEFVSTSGVKASDSFEADGKKYVAMTSFETSPYKDDAIAATIKLYVPPTVECADYDISFSQVTDFSSQDEKFTDFDTENAEISVIPFAAYNSRSRTVSKHSECKVFQKFDKNGKIIDASIGYRGDSNGDGVANIRDAAAIAIMCATGKKDTFNEKGIFFGDVNDDGVLNIRDAAAIAIFMAKGKTSWDDVIR